MARHGELVRTPVRRRSADARGPGGRPPPARNERCSGAAAQLAAIRHTLRHGAFQLETGSATAAARSPADNRTGLPDRLKSGIEVLSGISLDGVKVHYNSARPAQLNALAYAQGSDIHLAPGQEKHLPHEAWHLVQQAQGRVKPTLQMKGVAINADAGLEREADVMGALAIQLKAKPAAGFVLKSVPDRAAGAAGAGPAVQLRLRLNALQLADETVARKWNAVHDIIAAWRQGRDEQLEAWTAEAEGTWHNQRQPSWQERKLEAFKNMISRAGNADKKATGGADNLGWDGMIAFLEEEFEGSRFVGLAVARDVRLTGGHGTGDEWSVTGKYGDMADQEIVSGSVPDSEHGRGDNARTGARQSIKSALTGHNAQVDVLKTLAGDA